MNLRRQLTRNVLSNWMFLFLNLVIFFFLTPFIIDVLGPARAGIWFLLGSITGYFGIVAFGIPGATEKYVAEYLANDDRDQVNRIVSSSLFLSLWLARIGRWRKRRFAKAGISQLNELAGPEVDRLFRLQHQRFDSWGLLDDLRQLCLYGHVRILVRH